MSNENQEIACLICLHSWERGELTKHHLVPKSRKGTETVLLCKTCHRQIHATFTEKELEREFYNIETLLTAEKFQSFIKWIRKRKPTSRIKSKRSKRKGKK